ncbi:MAG: metal-dependent hydrolase [Planctomycetota bacterium]
MDNLTHSLCGWTLARAGLNRYSKWVTPLVIILANLPDVETVLLPGHTRAAYLLYHRGLTHSVLMLTIYALVFGTLLWLIERRTAPTQKPAPWKAITICAAGLFSHLLLDWFNNYGVRPGLPFNSTWFYGDMIFIMDPWVWLMFGLPIFLGTELNLQRSVLWTVLGLLTTTLVCYGIRGNLMPWPVLVVWLGAIGLAVLFRNRFHGRAERCSRIGLLVLSVYLIIAFTASRTATERAKAEFSAAFPSGVEIIKTSVQPYPAQPWRYDVFLQTNETLNHVNVNFLNGNAIDPVQSQLNLRDPALDKIRSTFEYQAWRVFARHPYVVRRGNMITFGDLRFRLLGGDWTSQTLELPDK